MGIQKFLSHFLESAGRLVDLRAYSEREIPLRIAVDISTWIFKACQGYSDMLADEKHLSNFGRASLLYQQQQQQQQQHDEEKQETATADGADEAPNNNKQSSKEVQEFVAKCCSTVIERLEALKVSVNADLLVVLDGRTPPIKEGTVGDRRQKRKENQQQRDLPVNESAMMDSPALERRIKANRRTGAGEHYSAVVQAVMAELRNHKLPFLVAPYEADGQLAFLCLAGYVDLVMTEDSDLVAYGVAKPILYKLSFNPENVLTRGVLVRQSDLAASVPGTVRKFDFLDFSPAMLACLFAATGCDYCSKLKGIGVKGACNDIRTAFLNRPRHEAAVTPPLEVLFRLLFTHTWDKDLTDDEREAYIQTFLAALLMYRHAVVYDPVQGCCKSLNRHPDPELMLYAPYAELYRDPVRRAAIVGALIPAPIATGIAEGWICPKRMKITEGVVCPANLHATLVKFVATLSTSVRQLGGDNADNDEEGDDDDDDDAEEEMETQQQEMEIAEI